MDKSRLDTVRNPRGAARKHPERTTPTARGREATVDEVAATIDPIVLSEADLRDAINLFPPESAKADLRDAIDVFLPESSLLTIVPAGPPVTYTSSVQPRTSRHVSPSASARKLRHTLHTYSLVVARAAIILAEALLSTARTAIQLVRRQRSTIGRYLIWTASALQSVVTRSTSEIARVRQSMGQRTVRSQLHVRLKVPRYSLQRSAVSSALRSTAQRFALLGVVAAGPIVIVITGIAVYTRLAPVASVHTPATLPTSSASIEPSAVPRTVDPRVAAVVVRPLTLESVGFKAAAFEERASHAATGAAAEVFETPALDGPAVLPAGSVRPVESVRAVQRVLNRFRDAFSIMDVRAVQAVWPSVDTRALGTAFHRLDEQNVDYTFCRISVVEAQAAALCRGVAQYVRTGKRTRQSEARQWQFALRKVDDRWLIEDVKSH